MYADLTDFLADLDKRRLLTRITEPVSPDLEIAAVTDRASGSCDWGAHAVASAANAAAHAIGRATPI